MAWVWKRVDLVQMLASTIEGMRSPPVVILMIHHSQWLELEIEHLFRVVEIEEFLEIISAANYTCQPKRDDLN